MVFYFKSNIVDPPATIYVGKDKFENEELIKYGWDTDICAHVYLRLSPEQTWDKLPPALVEECAQLTKANSIEGNKKDNITIIYTPWSNLLKTAGMATGQVSFHEGKKTRKILVPTRINATINRLEKTKAVGPASDLADAKEAHLAAERKVRRQESERVKKEQERIVRERREEKEGRENAWRELMTSAPARSNEEGFDEDDFM